MYRITEVVLWFTLNSVAYPKPYADEHRSFHDFSRPGVMAECRCRGT